VFATFSAVCNLQDPRDPLLFPAGTPLSTVMNIATDRNGPGGPIALCHIRVGTFQFFTGAWTYMHPDGRPPRIQMDLNTHGATSRGSAAPRDCQA
jgi:hypothetical protein